MNIKKLLLTIITLSITSYGATFNVSTTPQLRTALTTAATNGEDDTIIIADGTYKTTDDGQGTFIYLSNEANSLTLQGSSSKNVILSGDNQHQILNHQSTENAPMTLEKLSFVDGNNTNGDGGGIYTDYSLEVADCNFTNNYSAGRGGGFIVQNGSTNIKHSIFTNNNVNLDGGGFYHLDYHDKIDINNSIFQGNKAVNGGGCYIKSDNFSLNNSSFINNNTIVDGGGFYSYYVPKVINNSIFKENSAGGNGGGYRSSGGIVKNSIFINNTANLGGGIYSYSYTVSALNILMANNSSGIYIDNGGESHKIINSIFVSNKLDINCTSSTIISNLNSSFIDTSKITTTYFGSNNIFEGVNLGFIDAENGDYRLTESSGLIDKGISTITGITLPTTDLDGNARIVGGSIDIGPYEFSATKPTINSITFSGVAKEQTQLTFTTNYMLAAGRSISKVEYDYSNDGTWTTLDTHTYNTKGIYTVGVKITDNTGEFSSTTKTVTIAELPFNEMTDAQKLVKAIDPLYYESILEIIQSEKDSANASGVTVGENNVMLNPTAYNLVPQSSLAISANEITSLPTGFSLIGTKETITDLSIFNSAKIIWIYNSTTAKWSAWSSDATTMSKISSSSDVGTITTIPANSGIWVNK